MTPPSLLRRKLDRLLGEYSHSAQQVKEERQNLKQAKQQAEDTLSAQKLVQEAAEVVQQVAHQQITRIVSRCLEFIFEEPYSFRIEFKQRRGKTEAELHLIKEDMILKDPLHEVGGGVIDVCSFALAVGSLVLSQPQSRKLLVIDEGFKHLHGSESRQRVKVMIETLSKELDIQFIMTTQDNSGLSFGKVIELV